MPDWLESIRSQVGGGYETLGASLKELALITEDSGGAWLDRRDPRVRKVFVVRDGTLHVVEGVPDDDTVATSAKYTTSPIAASCKWSCSAERTMVQDDARIAIKWTFNVGDRQSALDIEYDVNEEGAAAVFARALASEIIKAQTGVAADGS